MRPISFIYIEKISQDEFNNEVKKWNEIGFIYYPFHKMFSVERVDNRISVSRGRPFNENCGLIRDSFVSTRGIGYIIVLPSSVSLTHEIMDKIAIEIKTDIEDLGISSYQLVTSLDDDSKKIDIMLAYNSIKQAKSKFNKLREV